MRGVQQGYNLGPLLCYIAGFLKLLREFMKKSSNPSCQSFSARRYYRDYRFFSTARFGHASCFAASSASIEDLLEPQALLAKSMHTYNTKDS